MSNADDEIQVMADNALSDTAELEKLVDQLAGGKRVDRQHAAAAINIVASTDPNIVAPYVDKFVDALCKPEAQTRWEALDILTLLVDIDARGCSRALPEAEVALFDEGSGPVRLAALRFFCKYGSTTQSRSDKVWPLIDEAIQCFHGDLEFNDMLVAITDFAGGKLSDEVKVALADRMSFDATNGKGSLQRKAQQILDKLN